jgi:predicted house-cleaning noncanonical NTP pyrophosphatase (MazG superfamily)
MTSYNKLVRDKIPEILDKKGITYEKRIAGNVEYKEELIKKLGEEILEFSSEGDIEELADVLEVVDALIKLPDYANVLEIQKKKKNERGGFDEKIILKGDK